MQKSARDDHLSPAVGPPRGLPPVEHEMRLKQLLRNLKRSGLDGAIITSPVARFYYTGLWSSAGTLWVDVREGPLLTVDFRYLVAARATAPFIPCRRQQRPAATTPPTRHLRRWRRAGYEGALSMTSLQHYRQLLPAVSEWEDVTALLAAQRAVKSAREQRAMRRAVAANDRLLAAVVAGLRPGMSEWEIRNLVRCQADLLGQGEAFDTIAAVGANGAECHHQPDATPWSPDQPLLLDFGLKLNHYCSDLTRCLLPRKARRRYRELHDLVLQANRRAIAAIKPGIPTAEVDTTARDFLDRAGYGKAFGHGLGHGLGLEVHEQPALTSGDKMVLQPGMVMTIEPGIYLPGRLGIRIEDVVLVTRSGCEVLSQAAHHLQAADKAADYSC